jgi:hypothetical protein
VIPFVFYLSHHFKTMKFLATRILSKIFSAISGETLAFQTDFAAYDEPVQWIAIACCPLLDDWIIPKQNMFDV